MLTGWILFIAPTVLSQVAVSNGQLEIRDYVDNNQVEEFQSHQKRQDEDARILQKLEWQRPIGMRKMSDDEGEMFFLDYWNFDPLGSRGVLDIAEANSSAHNPYNPALTPHAETSKSGSALRLARSIFKRDFECPVGTFSCTSINQPNSCCSIGEICISVQDTGLGPVGCCPQGQTCDGAVAKCNTDEGFSGCPDSPNGGCCIPGYQCQGIGCIRIGTETLTSRPVTTINPATITPSTAVQTVTTTVVISSVTSADPTTVTRTLTITPSTTSISSIPSSTVSAVAPVRPTSNSNTVTSITSSSTSTISAPATDGCPVAFYRCSAYYVGGCCRVGRDCSSTSCPPATTTSVAGNADRTVAAVAGGSSNCNSGWAACPAGVGGGCCPSGFQCGTAACTATAAGQSNVAKESTSAASTTESYQWVVLAVAAVSGIGMLAL